jgi:hypothetical protein
LICFLKCIMLTIDKGMPIVRVTKHEEMRLWLGENQASYYVTKKKVKAKEWRHIKMTWSSSSKTIRPDMVATRDTAVTERHT